MIKTNAAVINNEMRGREEPVNGEKN